MKDASEFWQQIACCHPTECWVWLGKGVMRNGYATARFGDSRKRPVHRIAWELSNGSQIESGRVVVRHKCDNRLCCNPDHLELGSHVDNTADMIERGRTGWDTGGRPMGRRNKLYLIDALRIRRLYALGNVTQLALAEEYGVESQTISEIIRNKIHNGRRLGRRCLRNMRLARAAFVEIGRIVSVAYAEAT